MNKLDLYCDGMSVPGRPFTPHFAKSKVLYSCIQTMRTLNYPNRDDTNGLTPEEYASGYTIYVFELTADKEINGTHRQAITFVVTHRVQLYNVHAHALNVCIISKCAIMCSCLSNL